MFRNRHFELNKSLQAVLFATVPLCTLVAVGCQPTAAPPATPGAPSAPSGNPPGGGSGAMGGGRGRMGGGGGGGPVAENASGAEIYQAKCGCHGPGGAGGRAPVLTGSSSKSDSELFTTIHDGRGGGKMPSFSSQLKDAQIKKVAAYLKTVKA